MALALPNHQSSGDLLLDRRFAYAEALAREGDHAAAADLLREVVGAAPHWLPAWMALGDAAERAGERAAAQDAYREAAVRDTEGRFGAALHFARLTEDAVELPPMPPAYVAALFDGYAARFDDHLVERLGYTGPAAVLGALAAAGAPPRFGRTLDLGCGTGLMARAIRHATDWLEGVDLSPAMIAQARRTALYDALAVASLEEALDSAPPGSFDLLLAADVFVYCGELGPIFRAAVRALRPGGLLAFTVQEGEAAVRLGPDLRFSHSRLYVRQELEAAGLSVHHLEAGSTRREAGKPVPGLVSVAARH